MPLDGGQVQVAVIGMEGAPAGEPVQPLLDYVLGPSKGTDVFVREEPGQSPAAELPAPLRQVLEVAQVDRHQT